MQKNFSHYLKKKKKKKKRKRKTKYLKEKSLKKLKKSWTINFEKLKNFEKNNKILNVKIFEIFQGKVFEKF